MFPKQRFVSNTSGFGAFEQQRAPTGTGHIKCEPVVGTDVVVKSGSSKIINVKKHCITCMTEYEAKSLEELRLEDYTAGRKGPTSGCMFTGFQQATESKPLFGGTNKFSFGGNTQNPTTSTDLFGNKFAFGATSTTDAFKQQRAPTGTGRIKYEPVVGTDFVVKSGSSNIINVKKHCITYMTEYEGKSLEELRLEDYTAGRKGSTTGGMFTGFQQATENKPLFGGTNKFSFGGNTQNPTTSTDLFGNKFAFGATSTTGTGIFTFGTATPSFDGFGTNTQNQQSTDLFGAKSATAGFGSTPASSSFETGLFNAKPFQKTLAPTVGSTAPSAPGTSCTGGAPNDLPPLSFHTVHGKNVRISREENKARRVEWHNEGVTFSARPVRVNEKVCLRFIEISDLWLGVIRFGFTNHDPSTLARELLRTACPNLTDKPGSWAKELDERYCEEDNILSYYVNSVGDVIFGINGEDKGLFFSGVDTTSSLWALIDLYGKCTAVQFLDPRAPNHMRRSTQSPLVDDDIPIGGMRSLSVEEELPPPRYQNPLAPLSLHWTKGRNVHFVNEKGVAARIENEFCQGYVFTARPMHPGQTIVVQILATESEFAGSLAIGLTSCDPATLRPCDLPDDAEKLLDRPEYWVIRRHVANGLQRGDELAVTLTVDGEVRVSKNWSDPVTDMHVDHTQRLWAFVDLYGETQKIRMLSSHTFPAQIPPQQLRMLAGSAAPITTSAGGSVPVVSLSSQTNGRNLSNNQQGSTLASAHYIEPIQASSQLCVAGYQPIPPQPEEEEERKVSAPGTSSTGDTPNDLPPLSFHRVHSKNMRISQDGFTVHRDKSLMIGVAFSARPVRVNEKVCVRLVEMTNRLFGGIRFGFTTHEDPTTLALALSNTPLIDYTDKPGYWVQELLQQFIELDNILSYYVNSAGDVIFGINGEDKGLLFSGVDTRSPLWALIDLYGKCTAVQFADPRALNQIGRSTQGTLVEDYRLIAPGTLRTSGTPNDLPPLSFHKVHGPNVRISQDGSTARCVHSGYGVSFSARPVRVNEKVCVRFVEITTRFKVIGFGFTTHDPTTFPYQSTYSFNTDRPGYWVEQLWKGFYEVDNIFYYYVDSRGIIHFGINGEDKGLFFSGVDTRSPLWALIDLYGDSCYGCSTVQFADPRAPNQKRRSTQRPLLRDDKLLSITVEEEALPTPRFQNPLVPLSLHRTKGRNVRFGNDRGIAARRAEESCQGYVFTARPMHPGQTIVVQILATESKFDESLAIGLTSCDPATLRPRDLPDDSEQLLDRPEYWVFRRDAANDLRRGDELAVTLTVNGEVCVSRNGTDPVTVMHVDHTQRLWAFVDIYGRTKKVKMLISQILPAQTPPQQVLAESAAPIAIAAAGTVLDASLLPQTNGQNLSNHQQGLSLASAHDIEPIQASSQPTPPQTEEKEEVSDDSGECTICYENPVDSVLYTCGHMCMCYSCAVQVWRDKGNGQCPLCRKEIIDVIRTYKS